MSDDQVFSASSTVDVWDRALIPLRADVSDAKVIVPNADWRVRDVEHNEDSLGKDRVGVFHSGDSVTIEFDQGDVSFGGFSDEHVTLVAGHIRADADADIEEIQSFSGALDLLTEDNANENATFELIARQQLTSGTATFTHTPDETGHYIYFLGTNESNSDGFQVNDGNLSIDGEVLVIGSDHIAVQASKPKIAPNTRFIVSGTNADVRGRSVPFTVSESPLSGDVNHAFVLYNDDTYTDSEFIVNLTEPISSDLDLENDSELHRSIDEVNGVAEVEDDMSVFGVDISDGKVARTVGISAIIDFIAELTASPRPPDKDLSDDTVVLHGSAKAFEDNATDVTFKVETFKNWTTGKYRWIYVAVGDDPTELAVNTGTVRVLSAPPTDGGGGGAPGGGGGGGGGFPPAPPANPPVADVSLPSPNMASAAVQNARANQPITVELPALMEADESPDSVDVELEAISITPAVDRDFTLSVTSTRGPPADTHRVEDTRRSRGLRYFDIEENLGENEVGEVMFRFRVRKSRLTALDQPPDNVALFRYTDGQQAPEDLATELVDETDSHFVFEASAPGFSVFAAGVKKPDVALTGSSLDQSAINPGDSVAVTGSVENTGDGIGTYTLDLVIDGTVVESQEVEVPAGETTTVTFTRPFDEPGSFDIAVNDVSAGTLSVEEPETPTSSAGGEELTEPQETPAEGQDDEPGESGEAEPGGEPPEQPGGPLAELGGFQLTGILFVVALVLALGIFAYTRRHRF